MSSSPLRLPWHRRRPSGWRYPPTQLTDCPYQFEPLEAPFEEEGFDQSTQEAQRTDALEYLLSRVASTQVEVVAVDSEVTEHLARVLTDVAEFVLGLGDRAEAAAKMIAHNLFRKFPGVERVAYREESDTIKLWVIIKGLDFDLHESILVELTEFFDACPGRTFDFCVFTDKMDIPENFSKLDRSSFAFI